MQESITKKAKTISDQKKYQHKNNTRPDKLKNMQNMNKKIKYKQ